MTRSPMDRPAVSRQGPRRVIVRVGALVLGALAVLLASLAVLLMIVIHQEYGLTTGDAIFGGGVAAIAVFLGYVGWLLWRRRG